MKRILLIMSVLCSMIAQGQTNNFDRLNVRESVRVGGVLITSVSTDTTFEVSSDYTLPTQAAVRSYMDENMRKTAAVVKNIEELIGYSGLARSVIVRDSLRGGVFYLQEAPLAIDSCITFPANGKGAGLAWQRQWDGSRVMFSWAGIKGNSGDEGRHLNRVIQARKRNGDTTGVVLVHNIFGTVFLKDVIVERGVGIVAEQVATNNVNAYVPHKIEPADGATVIFDFAADSYNSVLKGLYINGNYQRCPNLFAAIRFRGAFNYLYDNNVIFCANHAVWSDAGSFRVYNNNFQGMFGPQTFAEWNDFKGAFHVVATGDSYLVGNEIGAAAPYLPGQVADPINIIRDQVNRRVVAMYGGYFGNSYIENNLFENGDKGVVIFGAIYGKFKGNRYEMNGGGGMTLRNVFYSTFDHENYGNNSLACDGCYSDLRLDTGAVGFCTFTCPTFVNLPHVNVPTSNYRVKYNIQNFTAPGANNLIMPIFDDGRDGSAYCMNGPFDTSIQAVPFNWVEGQYDPANPYYKTVTAGNNKSPYTLYEGFVRMSAGTSNTIGSVQFGKADNSVVGAIGGNTGNDMYYRLFTPNASHQFLDGNMFVQKTGGVNFTLWGLDNTQPTVFRMLSGASGDKIGQMTVDNVTGDWSFITGGKLKLGINNNLSLSFDGKVSMAPPAALSGDGVMLYRNNATGEIQYGAAPLDSVTAKTKFIQNQYSVKQTARSYYDTAKVINLVADTVKASYSYSTIGQMTSRLKNAGYFYFENGDIMLQKNGSPAINVTSTDNNGNPYISLNTSGKIGNIALDRLTGAMTYATSNGESHILGTKGEYLYQNGAFTLSNAGVSVFNVSSSDSTDNAIISLSMGSAATKKAYIELDHTNGDLYVHGTRDIKIGHSNNVLFKANGLTYWPTVPTPSNIASSSLLGRNTSTGEQVLIDPASFKAADTPVAANSIFAGPGTGANNYPSFRALVPADIPALDASKITGGVLPVSRGGTGLTSLGSAGQQVRVNTGGTGLEFFTPSASGESTGTIYGDGMLSSFPTGVTTLMLRPTGNNTIDLATGATYPGSPNRVAVIVNFSNYTYMIHGVTVTEKIVYAAWDASGSFIGFTTL